MLAGLGWTGLAMVEFKLAEDGARLMEVNGRLWGSLPLAVNSGRDFPARLPGRHPPGPPSPGGPRRRAALTAALRLLSPADGFDILSLGGPRPGLAEIAKIARKLGRKLGDGGEGPARA